MSFLVTIENASSVVELERIRTRPSPCGASPATVTPAKPRSYQPPSGRRSASQPIDVVMSSTPR